MKYKISVVVAILTMVIGFSVRAEIVEYKDDYVSFSYDDEI